MTPEIPHSDNVFAGEMLVNLSLAGSTSGHPVLENLDRGAVGYPLSDAPVCVRGSHDRGDGSRFPVEYVASDFLDVFRHQFPLSVYGYTPNGAPNCDKLSRVQIIHSRENFGAKFNNIACASLVGAELVGSNDALIRSQFVPSVGQKPYASPHPTVHPAPPFIACQSSGELSGANHSRRIGATSSSLKLAGGTPAHSLASAPLRRVGGFESHFDGPRCGCAS